MEVLRKVCTFLVIIIIVFLGGIIYIINQPKAILGYSLSKTSKDLFNLTPHLFNPQFLELIMENIDDKALSTTAEVSLNIETANHIFGDNIADYFNDMKFKLQYGEDYKNQKRILELNPIINNEALSGVSYYFLGDKQYLYFKDIYDKYIELEDKAYSSIYQEKYYEEIKYVLNQITKLVTEAINNRELIKSVENIIINDKKVKTNKITFILTEKRYFEILMHISKGIKKDQKSINALVSLSNYFFGSVVSDILLDETITDKFIKEKLDNFIKEIEQKIEETDDNITEGDENETKTYFSIYTKRFTNIPVQYEMINKIKTNFETKEESIKYQTYNTKDKKEIKVLEILNDDGKSVYLLSKEGAEKYSYQIATYNKDEKEESLLNGEFVINREEIINNKEFKSNILLSLKERSGNEEQLSLTIKIDLITKIEDSLVDVEINKSIGLDQFMEEDMESVMEILLEPFMSMLLPYTSPSYFNVWDSKDDFNFDDFNFDDFNFDDFNFDDFSYDDYD